jgi:hypothetical protein
VLDYTPVAAAHHARLLAHVRRSGRPRGAHDLIIAAHAAETGRLVLTRDAKARFSDLPGILLGEAEEHLAGGPEPAPRPAAGQLAGEVTLVTLRKTGKDGDYLPGNARLPAR